MSASYPSSTKSFSTHSAAQTIASADINAIQDEVVAVETGLRDGVAHPLIPLTDDSVDLGSSSKQFQDCYLSGSLFIDGAAFASTSSWTSYTPTWGNTGTANTLGNGTIAGFYLVVGKIVFYTIKLTWGSGTISGDGAWTFSMPVTLSVVPMVGSARLHDASVGDYVGIVDVFSSAAIAPYAAGAVSGILAASPFTWTTSDALTATGFGIVA